MSGFIYALHAGDYEYRYVGLTYREPALRLARHRKNARHGGNLPVHAWIRKHPNLCMDVLEVCDTEEDTRFAESKWIAALHTFKLFNPRGLNLTTGGEGCLGYKHSDQTKIKLSLAGKGATMPPRSAEHRRRISESKQGHEVSAETRKKISNAQRGKTRKPPSQETRNKLSEAQKGRKFSDEHREALSRAQKKRFAKNTIHDQVGLRAVQ